MIAAWQKARNHPETGYLTAAENQALLREAQPALQRLDEDKKKPVTPPRRQPASASPSAPAPAPAPRTEFFRKAPYYALGVIETTRTWVLMAVRESPILTRGSCSRPAAVVTL